MDIIRDGLFAAPETPDQPMLLDVQCEFQAEMWV